MNDLMKSARPPKLGDQTYAEREHQTYLRVAELVLRDTADALSAREIVERGVDRGLFGDHGLSKTPEKSMQARLSIDILKKTGASTFVRTAKGRFQLRGREGTSSKEPSEYIAERRILRTPDEEVLCVPEAHYKPILTFQGIDTDHKTILSVLLKTGNHQYVSRADAEDRNDVKQLITYVFVQSSNRLLLFRRSYLSRAAEFLRGSKCIGFGGHVTAADADMLSLADLGLEACARRELSEELRIEDTETSTSHATVRTFQQAPIELLGVLNDDSSEVGRRHVAVVYRAWLEDWQVAKRLHKGDASIKAMTWLDVTKDKVDLVEYEYWSQLCLRKFFPSIVISEVSFKIFRKNSLERTGPIVVAGRIGSGKTETALYLSKKLGLPLISSGRAMETLLNSTVSSLGRAEFQRKAVEFILSPNGPENLAAELVNQIREQGSTRVILDGIRQTSTLDAIKELLGEKITLVFVQTPPDVSYELYRFREAPDDLTFSYREYLELYDAKVEAELPSLGRRADIYVYNSFGLDALRRTLDRLSEIIADQKQ